MPLANRSLIRAEIAAMLLLELAGTAEEVLDQPPLSLRGASPVVSLHAGGTTATFFGADMNQLDHEFIITVYVNREAHGNTAEDVLDVMYTAVTQAIRDNVTGTNFMELSLSGSASQPAFAVIDGIPYRLEEITVIARSNPTG